MGRLILGAALALLVLYPAIGGAVLAVVGALLLSAAGQPVCWAFTVGLLSRPPLAARISRLFRSTP